MKRRIISLICIFGIIMCSLSIGAGAGFLDEAEPISGEYLLVYNSSTDVNEQPQSTGEMLFNSPDAQLLNEQDYEGPVYSPVEYIELKKPANTNDFNFGSGIIDIEVGETFYFDFDDNYVLDEFGNALKYKLESKLLYIGEHCKVFVETVNTDVIDETRAAEIGEEFDSKYDDMVEAFGEPYTNADGDIYINLCNIKDSNYYSGVNVYTAGFYEGGDYTRDGIAMINVDIFPTMGKAYDPAGDGVGEILHGYMNTSSGLVEGDYGYYIPKEEIPVLEPADFDVSKSYSTLVHEFQHLISWSYVLREFYENNYKQVNLDLYINEAQSMAAERMFYGDDISKNRIRQYNNSSVVKNGAVLAYTSYGQNKNEIGANYGLAYLFGQYLRAQTKDLPGGGNSIYRKILESEYGDYRAVMEALDLIGYPYASDFETLVKNFYTALILKESYGPYGFMGESEFDSINVPLFSGNKASLKATSGIVFNMVDEVFIPDENAGKNIRFVGVSKNENISNDPNYVIYKPVISSVGFEEDKFTDAVFGERVTAEIYIKNESLEIRNPVLILTCYSEGKLLCIDTATVQNGNLLNGEGEMLTATIEVPEDINEKYGNIKIMILEGNNNLSPVVDVISYTLDVAS